MPPSAPAIVPVSEASSETIFVKGDAKNKYHQIRLDEVLYIEGLKNYVLFICEDKKVITLQNLKDLEAQLPADRFYRIHKSFIIHLKFIQQIEGHSVLIKGKRLAIGASYRAAFYNAIKRL